MEYTHIIQLFEKTVSLYLAIAYAWKIFIIAVICGVLFLIETLLDRLLRKLQKDPWFTTRFLDDAHMKGIAIIVIVALMLWYSVEP